MRRRYTLSIIPLFALAVLFASCSSDENLDRSGGTPPTPSKSFLFGIRGDASGSKDFVAMTDDPTTISRLEADLTVPPSQRVLHINGLIEVGNGGHNLAWGWHFVPNGWVAVTSSNVLCDGDPAVVNSAVENWINNHAGRFCPWASYVKREYTP